jgi:hypothetical protein
MPSELTAASGMEDKRRKPEIGAVGCFWLTSLAFSHSLTFSVLHRLADALGEGGEVVVYGCLSGKPSPFSWQSFVFRELKVSGFNYRRSACNVPCSMGCGEKSSFLLPSPPVL